MLFGKAVYEMTIEEAKLEQRAAYVLKQHIEYRPRIHAFMAVIFLFLALGYLDHFSPHKLFFVCIAIFEAIHNLFGYFLFKSSLESNKEMLDDLEAAQQSVQRTGCTCCTKNGFHLSHCALSNKRLGKSASR